MKKKTIFIKTIGAFILTIAFGIISIAQAHKDSLLSRINENHQLLASRSGSWTFTGRHLPRDSTVKGVEFKGTMERKAILDGRYFVCETTGGKLIMPWSDGKEVIYQDMIIEGYDNIKGKFYKAIAANHWATDLLTIEGSYDAATKTFTYEGEIDRGEGRKVKIRRLEKLIDNDHYVVEAYTIRGDGQAIKASESWFTRKKQIIDNN